MSTTVLAPTKLALPRVAHSLLAAIERLGAGFACRRLHTQRQCEAAAVRQFALRVAAEDRGFASDLLAAADRHERGG